MQCLGSPRSVLTWNECFILDALHFSSWKTDPCLCRNSNKVYLSSFMPLITLILFQPHIRDSYKSFHATTWLALSFSLMSLPRERIPTWSWHAIILSNKMSFQQDWLQFPWLQVNIALGLSIKGTSFVCCFSSYKIACWTQTDIVHYLK